MRNVSLLLLTQWQQSNTRFIHRHDFQSMAPARRPRVEHARTAIKKWVWQVFVLAISTTRTRKSRQKTHAASGRPETRVDDNHDVITTTRRVREMHFDAHETPPKLSTSNRKKKGRKKILEKIENRRKRGGREWKKRHTHRAVRDRNVGRDVKEEEEEGAQRGRERERERAVQYLQRSVSQQ
jgi:hypothetical protein